MRILILLFWSGILFVLGQATLAQTFLTLSDEDCVGLSLDMIRKGIQQEQAARVLKVVGDAVSVKGVETKSDGVAQNLNKIFNNSSQRARVQGSRAITRTSSKQGDSNLWDFDILSPKITMIGNDSAVVECELILWEADTGDPRKTGSRIAERLVFWSPYEDRPKMTASHDPFRWQLIACDHLFDFLADYGVSGKATAGGKGETK